MPLSHSHYCKHCDRTFTCRRLCGFDRDISKVHDCDDRKRYVKAMAKAMSHAGCPQGCISLPCRHGVVITFPRIGPRIVTDPCVFDCDDYQETGRCEHIQVAKIGEPIRYDSATGKHVEDCLCHDCIAQFRSALLALAKTTGNAAKNDFCASGDANHAPVADRSNPANVARTAGIFNGTRTANPDDENAKSLLQKMGL